MTIASSLLMSALFCMWQRSAGGKADCGKVVFNGRVHQTTTHFTVFHYTAAEGSSSAPPTDQVLTTRLMMSTRTCTVVCIVVVRLVGFLTRGFHKPKKQTQTSVSSENPGLMWSDIWVFGLKHRVVSVSRCVNRAMPFTICPSQSSTDDCCQ